MKNLFATALIVATAIGIKVQTESMQIEDAKCTDSVINFLAKFPADANGLLTASSWNYDATTYTYTKTSSTTSTITGSTTSTITRSTTCTTTSSTTCTITSSKTSTKTVNFKGIEIGGVIGKSRSDLKDAMCEEKKCELGSVNCS